MCVRVLAYPLVPRAQPTTVALDDAHSTIHAPLSHSRFMPSPQLRTRTGRHPFVTIHAQRRCVIGQRLGPHPPPSSCVFLSYCYGLAHLFILFFIFFYFLFKHLLLLCKPRQQSAISSNNQPSASASATPAPVHSHCMSHPQCARPMQGTDGPPTALASSLLPSRDGFVSSLGVTSQSFLFLFQLCAPSYSFPSCQLCFFACRPPPLEKVHP